MNRWTRRALLAVTASCLLVAPAQAADPPEVRNLPTDRFFTPNGDGSEDVVRVTYGLSEPVRAAALLGGTPPTTTKSIKVKR